MVKLHQQRKARVLFLWITRIADRTSYIMRYTIQPAFPLFRHQYDCQELVIFHINIFLCRRYLMYLADYIMIMIGQILLFHNRNGKYLLGCRYLNKVSILYLVICLSSMSQKTSLIKDLNVYCWLSHIALPRIHSSP